MMKIQPAIIKTFSCSSSMSIRRPLDQIDDFEKEEKEPLSRNKSSDYGQSQESSFSASEYEGPGEKSINQALS